MRLVLPYEMNLTELLKEKTIFLFHRNTEPVKGDKKTGNIFREDDRTKPLGQTCLPLPHSLQEGKKTQQQGASRHLPQTWADSPHPRTLFRLPHIHLVLQTQVK